jgi:pimeloyl-ACP methyl ester carboxylesterase
MASIKTNGITMEYESTGDGEPLLLIMGLGGQLTDWPENVPELLASRGFRVIAVDNRDQGLSTEMDWTPPSQAKSVLGTVVGRPPKAGYLLSDMAADTAGLLDALGLDSAHVVGASMGGMIAQTLAIEHPSRVRSLTSIMSNTGDRKAGRPAARLLAAMARLPEATPATAVDRSVQTFKLISGPHFDEEVHRRRAAHSVARSFRPAGTARQTAAIMASPDRTGGLRSLRVPTLVVHGLLDPLVRPSGGIATAKAVPDSRLLMYPDMGHDLPAPRLGETIEAIRRNAERAS